MKIRFVIVLNLFAFSNNFTYITENIKKKKNQIKNLPLK